MAGKVDGFWISASTAKKVDHIRNERKWSKSQVIRKAIDTYFDLALYNQDVEQKIEKICEITEARPAVVLLMALKTLETILEVDKNVG